MRDRPLHRYRSAWWLVLLLAAGAASAQTTRYVATSGTDAGNCSNALNPCATIAYAIDQCAAGDTIQIADGVYTEAEELMVSIPLTLNGASRDGTIIQAHPSPGQATHRVVTSTATELTITDLTVRHGVAVGTSGGGIFTGASTLTLENVTVRDNVSPGSGGGLWFSGGGDLSITDSRFVDNDSTGSGGGLYRNNATGDATLERVVFNGNTSDGSGGGMYNRFGGPLITNVVFEDNVGFSGGGYFNHQSTSTLSNVIFANNSADGTGGDGGGLYVSATSGGIGPTLVNVSFYGNDATDFGGGVNIDSGTAVFDNVIVWGNTAAGGQQLRNRVGTVTLSYSLYRNDAGDVTGDFTISDSLTTDPLFSDPDVGNLRLQDGSPAINAGDSATDLSVFPGGPGAPVDLAGGPRVFDGRIDIGAYEWQPDGVFADRFEP